MKKIVLSKKNSVFSFFHQRRILDHIRHQWCNFLTKLVNSLKHTYFLKKLRRRSFEQQLILPKSNIINVSHGPECTSFHKVFIRDHSFSTYEKFSEKLTFLCMCAYQEVRNVSLLENFAFVLNDWPYWDWAPVLGYPFYPILRFSWKLLVSNILFFMWAFCTPSHENTVGSSFIWIKQKCFMIYSK